MAIGRFPAWRAALSLAALALPLTVFAADHAEAPKTKADKAADIADVYAFFDSTNLDVVVTFAGHTKPATGQVGNFDPGVDYQVLIDNNGDNVADIDIDARYGKDPSGKFGIQVKNLPGASGTVVGPVETVIDSGSAKVWTGLADDPFFFDVEGFKDTVTTGTLSIMSTRDGFAGENVTAIVLQMPIAKVKGSSGKFQVWATTGRKP